MICLKGDRMEMGTIDLDQYIDSHIISLIESVDGNKPYDEVNENKKKLDEYLFNNFCTKAHYLNECEPAFCIFRDSCKYIQLLNHLAKTKNVKVF
jgi:hypothetical protein